MRICAPAEQWLAQAGTQKERQPTALQTEYIIASRKAAARRQRITLGAVTFGLVIALVLAALAFYQRNLAEERRRQARARELTSEARLAISSPAEGLQLSTLLALESLNSAWTLDGFIACVDAISRLPRLVRVAHDGKVLALAFSKDHRWLASESVNGKIAIWDARGQKQITPEMQGSSLVSAALAFSPDGRWLASASAQAALVWDTTTWKLIKKLPHPGHHAGDNKISSVAFNPDGSLLATATHYSPLVAMYNTATWEEDVAWAEAMKTEPEGKGAQVAAFSPNGKWLMTGGDALTVWDTATKKKIARIEKIKPWSFAFSADGGMLAVGGQDGHLQLLKIPEGFAPVEHERVFVATGGGASISAVAFSPNENCLASARLDGRARVWNLPLSAGEPGAGQRELDLPCYASAIVFSPEDSAVITGNADGTIATWRLTSGADVEVLPHTAAVTAVAFSRSGAFLVTSSDVLRIYKTGAGGWSEVTETKLPSAASRVGFSPDGLWVAAFSGKTVHVFSSGTWAESLPAFELADEVIRVSFSPDGKWMATETKGVNRHTWLGIPSKTQIWDLATHREIAWATAPDQRSSAPAGGGGTMPDAGGDTKLAVTSASWEALRLRQSPSSSSDGRWSVAGGQLIDVQSRREVELVKHDDTVNDAVFSPDAVWLVTASNDRSVRFWPLRLAELRAEAAARLGRNLTYDEWQRFFPDESYPRTFATLPVHPSVRDKASELAKERRRAKESTPDNSKQPSQGQAP